jgi:hypothetical protein
MLLKSKRSRRLGSELRKKLERRPVFEALDRRELMAADVGLDFTSVLADQSATEAASGVSQIAPNTWDAIICEDSKTSCSPANIQGTPAHGDLAVGRAVELLSRLDVNHDGYVTRADACYVLNELNRDGPRRFPSSTPEGEEPAANADVNGDGFLTPLDVLQIVNHLNSQPFTNPDNPLDVDASGDVTDVDARLIVSYLNVHGTQELTSDSTKPNTPPYLDVDGDGRVSPADALRVVNYLNASPATSVDDVVGSDKGSIRRAAGVDRLFEAWGTLQEATD